MKIEEAVKPFAYVAITGPYFGGYARGNAEKDYIRKWTRQKLHEGFAVISVRDYAEFVRFTDGKQLRLNGLSGQQQ